MAVQRLPSVDLKPRDDEIDVLCISHPGKVRAENQDHFLLASIHKRVQILQTNLASKHTLPIDDQRLAIRFEQLLRTKDFGVELKFGNYR